MSIRPGYSAESLAGIEMVEIKHQPAAQDAVLLRTRLPRLPHILAQPTPSNPGAEARRTRTWEKHALRLRQPYLQQILNQVDLDRPSLRIYCAR